MRGAEHKIMVAYDQWSYMTITFRIFDGLWDILRVGIQTGDLIVLGYLQKVKNSGPENVVFNVGINFAGLWLADFQFSHAGSQCAAVESKDFCSPVLAAYLPISLLKYPDNIVTLNFIQRFFGCR